jgi:hypothetical protein
MNYVHRFTYAEYLDRAINGKPVSGSLAETHGRLSRNVTNWSKFAKTASFEEATKLATEGWSEGREFIGEILSKLDDLNARTVTTPQPFNDVSGDYVDVGAYLEGVPECMIRWAETECQKRVARILFNMAASGGVSNEAIQWRGATTLALIDRLEAQGIRVELDIVFSVFSQSNPDNTTEILVTLKESDEPLHLDRLAFHLAHPSSLRRLSYSLRETFSKLEVRLFGTHDKKKYGLPRTSKPEGYDLIVPAFALGTMDESISQVESMFTQICEG